jgi:hypothetical protein
MKTILKSRIIHIITLVIITLIAAIVCVKSPELTGKATDTMAFLGFWITAYGLIVAILEVIRLSSVSEELRKAAAIAHNALLLQFELQEVKSCIEIINSSVADLSNKKAVPAIFISRIKQVYFAVFVDDSYTPEHKKNILILNSYFHISASRVGKTAPNPAYQASSATENPLNSFEHPYQKTIDTLKRIHDDLSQYSISKTTYKSEAI